MVQAHGGSTDSSGLGDLFDSNTNHLTSAHSVFLRHWDWLIDLEAKEMQVHFWCSNMYIKFLTSIDIPFLFSFLHFFNLYVSARKEKNLVLTEFEE